MIIAFKQPEKVQVLRSSYSTDSYCYSVIFLSLPNKIAFFGGEASIFLKSLLKLAAHYYVFEVVFYFQVFSPP
jgi:hypothetical protein